MLLTKLNTIEFKSYFYKMRFYKTERETVWSILQFIGSSLNLPHNTIMTDAFILICTYHNYSIQQKKSGEINNDQLKVFRNGKLYKIIASAVFLACKMNDNSRTLDDIFSSLIRSLHHIQYIGCTKINAEETIELTSNENNRNKIFVTNEDGNIELTDSFKYELICVYELLILHSINFSPIIKWNPFRFIKTLSKKMILGNFQICEKVTYFIYLILKSSKFLTIPVNIIVASATEAAYEISKVNSETTKSLEKEGMPVEVEEWIKLCKSQNFPAFESATSICCSSDS